jgi:peptide-methionine (S)-S-oxide reductase
MTFSIVLLAATLAAGQSTFPAPAEDLAPAKGEQTAVFAGGCFWGVEAVFERLAGVRDVVSGFSGGDRRSVSYEAVSSGTTGHAEAVRITYDPARITYGQLLEVFFAVAHDPTQLNRQGPDEGTQYRSSIFYTDAQQKRVAAAYIAQLNAARIFPAPIVTTVVTLEGFHPAEPYHQDFVRRNPRQPYVAMHDLPKLEHLEQAFPQRLKPR